MMMVIDGYSLRRRLVELIPHSLVSPPIDVSLEKVDVSHKDVESSEFGLFLIILEVHQNMEVLDVDVDF